MIRLAPPPKFLLVATSAMMLGGSFANPQSGAGSQQKPTASPVVRQDPNPKSQSPKQTPEQRRAVAQVTAAYPRTRALLGYLERHDRAGFDAVLGQGVAITRRRTAAAMRMAREHHPELARLIARSKRRSPRAYESGVRALVADYARLQRARQAGESQFQVALDEWKTLSQVRLLSARMTAANQEEILPRIRELLVEGEKIRRRQLEQQIQRHREQIQRLTKRLEQEPDRAVQRQLRAIQKRIPSNSGRPGDNSSRRRK